MPIPKPKSGEKKEEFISRCVSILSKEEKDGEKIYPDNDQRLAICFSSWEDKNEDILHKINNFINDSTTSTGVAQYSTPISYKKRFKDNSIKIDKEGEFWILYIKNKEVYRDKSLEKVQKEAKKIIRRK